MSTVVSRGVSKACGFGESSVGAGWGRGVVEARDGSWCRITLIYQETTFLGRAIPSPGCQCGGHSNLTHPRSQPYVPGRHNSLGILTALGALGRLVTGCGEGLFSALSHEPDWRFHPVSDR